MALNRINGREDLFLGGIFGLRRPSVIAEHKITHVVSVIKYSLPDDDAYRGIQHLSIDIDDMEDQDILVHLPQMVRFIERGLYGDVSPASDGARGTAAQQQSVQDKDAILPAEDLASAQLARLKLTPVASSARGPTGAQPTGAVFVHCAMGKSRSVSAVIAYLLWKHPQRFGRADPTTAASQAIAKALKWVRDSRPIAEPNDGFMRQLAMWWDMGCPADSDDAVDRHPVYQRWLYRREVDNAAQIGRAPDWIRFEDEEAGKDGGAVPGEDSGLELKCKKCRRVLVTKPFIVPHQGRNKEERPDCPHVFIEALSWMRPVLEEGLLEGRLVCPTAKCGASVGRYAWQGFKCSCGEWVAPAISLQKSKVDEMVTPSKSRTGSGPASAASRISAMAAMGIRLPPGAAAAVGAGGRKENL
ncbi:protein-tyrosine phosphatase-like protein [Lasiosphaeris hirsuta]|uniref:protein-tyrosine-phosphatase n=1 Tax=Lasiosphaeris hirsuta TaxID=260670 RepID=A0AA40AZ13_9PEZI|nr:protein-tyrosine phosphatase-like protein [Lasiosphaeris hirsuta]